jgi:hypothetical protein
MALILQTFKQEAGEVEENVKTIDKNENLGVKYL